MILPRLYVAALIAVWAGVIFPAKGWCVEDAPSDSVTGDRVYELAPIVVDAPRPVAPMAASSAVQVNVDSLVLSAAPMLEHVLREVPLLHVRTNSRGEAEITARGSESRNVAILVDGVPITLAWDARADVSIIPATAFRELEFVPGLSSMLHGPNVTGGLLDVRIGRSLVQPRAASTHASRSIDHVGSVGTSLGCALPIQAEHGTWLLQGGGGFRDTPGVPLANDVEERPSSDEDLRLNTDGRAFDGFLALRYRRAGGTWASLSGLAFDGERGIAAELGVPDAAARFWRYPHVSRTLFIVAAGTGRGTSPFGRKGEIEAGFGFDNGRTDIDAFTSPAYDTLDSFEDGKDRTLTARLVARQEIGSRGEIAGTWTGAAIRHDEIIPDGSFRYRQNLWSAGLETSWRLMENRGGIGELAIRAGGAYDVAETPETGGKESLGRIDDWGGLIGLSLRLSDHRTAMHAGLSRRGRFPSLRELYSGALNRFVPNPDLQPENTISAEVGVSTRSESADVQAVLFHHGVEDAVVRIRLEDGRFMRINQNDLESFGTELHGSYARGPIGVAGNLVLQDVSLKESDGGESRKPENMPEVMAGLGAHALLFRAVTVGGDATYTGTQFAIDPVTGNDTELDAATILSAYLSRTWPLSRRPDRSVFTRLTTRVAVENILDEAHYQQYGLPEPGRRFRLELRLD
ncbi:MAG TPA: TonB-dependent receptor [Candidatus Eisenbacteria bacterium]|nr:TonB-dependent receptor [Candidatus Eisenbacteria bacterium]